MPGDKYRATWTGRARDTQEDAIADGAELEALLLKHAPHLLIKRKDNTTYTGDNVQAHLEHLSKKDTLNFDKTIPGSHTWNQKSKG